MSDTSWLNRAWEATKATFSRSREPTGIVRNISYQNQSMLDRVSGTKQEREQQYERPSARSARYEASHQVRSPELYNRGIDHHGAVKYGPGQYDQRARSPERVAKGYAEEERERQFKHDMGERTR